MVIVPMLKVCVKEAPLDLDFMICDVLREMGICAWRAADQSYNGADLVILPCDSIGLNQLYSNEIDTTKRPLVALWLVDPLPPAGLGAEARKHFRQIASLDLRRRLREPWGEIFHKYMPGAREIMRFRRSRAIRRFRRLLTQTDFKYFDDCHNREWERVCSRAHIFEYHVQNKRVDLVFTTTAAKKNYLTECGYEAVFIPFGYHNLFGRRLSLRRDIDVVFLGRLNNKKRISVLSGLQRRLENRGVRMEIIERDHFGEERTRLMNRAKISLDLPRVPWDFACERFLISMSCGAMVVSMGSRDCAPYVRYKHYVQAQESDLEDKICHYLKDDEARNRIVEGAYDFVTSELVLRNSLSKIIDFCCCCV